MPYPSQTVNGESLFKRLSIKPLHIKGAGALYFSSIITEFSDSWTPRWSATNVYGRMDPVSAYSGTGRELALGFRVISDNKEEASKNMKNIQRLIQYQYPTYHKIDGVKILAAPPYFRINFMNVIGGGRYKFVQGYFNSAIQINPGFQSKDQAQYFSNDWSKLYFSDVNIVLRMQVLHEGFIGRTTTSSAFKPNGTYPYGVITEVDAIPAPHPNTATNGDSTPSQNTTTNQAQTEATSAVTPNPVTPPMTEAEKGAMEALENINKVIGGYSSAAANAMFDIASGWDSFLGGAEEEVEDPSEGAERPGTLGAGFGPTHVDEDD